MGLVVKHHAPVGYLHWQQFLEHDKFAALGALARGEVIYLLALAHRDTRRLGKFTLSRHLFVPFASYQKRLIADSLIADCSLVAVYHATICLYYIMPGKACLFPSRASAQYPALLFNAGGEDLRGESA
jgi:hypothetical protein